MRGGGRMCHVGWLVQEVPSLPGSVAHQITSQQFHHEVALLTEINHKVFQLSELLKKCIHFKMNK